MNQAYNHKDSPLNKRIVRELICELYSGKEYVKREVIIEEILQYHLDQGGKAPKIQLPVAVSNVLREMAHVGEQKNATEVPVFGKSCQGEKMLKIHSR